MCRVIKFIANLIRVTVSVAIYACTNVICILLIISLMLPIRGIPAAQTPPPHIPPVGITVPEAERKELPTGLEALGREIAELKTQFRSDSERLRLLPDIEIFHKAVDWALRYDEFFEPKQIAFAKTLLRQAHERAAQLRSHQAPWLNATGLVVRGYQSKLDGSLQPYGLVVPSSRSRRTPSSSRRASSK